MNLFPESLRKALSALYGPGGDVSAPNNGHKNAPLQRGANGELDMGANPTKIVSNKVAGVVNPAFDVPLRKGYGIEEVRVTPEIAQHWLTFNTSNRELTQAKIEQFVQDMEGGYWARNGEPVKFSYGKLLDGQHRLTSIAVSGVTIPVIVVFGLDSEAQVTMDTGRSRSPRDVLSIEGLDKWESSVLGSALHTIIAYESGLAVYSARKYTNREVRNYYLEHSSALVNTINRVKGYPRKFPLLPHARAVALHYIFGKVDADAADMFFDRLLGGEGLVKSSPIFHLRNRLQMDAMEKKKRTAYEQFHFVVRAWNACRRGSSLKSDNTLRPRQGEPFPEIM